MSGCLTMQPGVLCIYKTKTMAQIGNNESTTGRKHRGVKGRKMLPTRVDMTPMVDLAFLLITFFIFTATMNEPVTMDLAMPKDGPPTVLKESGALTVLVDEKDVLHYYEGEFKGDQTVIQKTTISGIRQIIINKKREVEARYVTNAKCEDEKKLKGANTQDCRQQDFFVLIKPTGTANYKQVVNMLDEMTINRVLHYSIANINKEESQLVQL